MHKEIKLGPTDFENGFLKLDKWVSVNSYNEGAELSFAIVPDPTYVGSLSVVYSLRRAKESVVLNPPSPDIRIHQLFKSSGGVEIPVEDDYADGVMPYLVAHLGLKGSITSGQIVFAVLWKGN